MAKSEGVDTTATAQTVVSEVDDRLIRIIGVPVTEAQRARYYVLTEKINELRLEMPKGRPKKMTQLTREALEQVMDEVEQFVNLRTSERDRE
jgi:hypothetical protein